MNSQVEPIISIENDKLSATDTTTLPPTQEPIPTHNIALTLIAFFATIFVLSWAQTFVISLLLGILFAYTLNPLVAWLEYIKIPRLIGTTVVMLTVISMIVFGTYALRGEMQTIVDQLPKAASKLSSAASQWQVGHNDNMQKMQLAAAEIEKATIQQIAPPSGTAKRPTHVVIDTPSFKLNTLVWSGWRGVMAFLGEGIMVAFLTYFLLLSGDTFKRKLVRLTGPTLTRKRITVHILDDINNSIQKYMFMLLITNAILGVITWGVFTWLGLDNAGVWALVAAMLHIIPYFGPAITAGAAGMAAFIQFETISSALQIAGASLLIATLVGTLITTWMTGRFAKMNTAAVFISLLFWSWLWGIWGMLLSIPIIVIVRAVSQHIEQLHPIAELLGD